MNTPTSETTVSADPCHSMRQDRATMNHKPVFTIPVQNVINFHSKFHEKLLCDGPTFSAGTACAYSCAFCFVESQHARNAPVQNLLKTEKVQFEDIVIRREKPVQRIVELLTDAKGRPKYKDPADTRVIYASPLVDVAANIDLADETIEICQKILELTCWQIRLLSKSSFLPRIATKLENYRDRLIFGVSTGTLDDGLARSFEQGTALVSKRIQSLHWLQDNKFRTFGMICPSLPQTDYNTFAGEMAKALRADRLEHVWAEPLNVRGDSMVRTVAALAAAGYVDAAAHLTAVSTDPALWETYSRETFLAETRCFGPDKLRFLQYVNAQNFAWWRDHAPLGAVLLGKYAEEHSISSPAVLPPPPLPPQYGSPVTINPPRDQSTAGRKAWATMRAKYQPEELFARASKAALKAWETRRKNKEAK